MKSPTVCIVDDDPKIVYAVGIVLKEKGYEIHSCSRGQECLRLLRKREVDVIFLDISMPDMSGLQVLKAIRDRGLDVPVIVITGFGTMETAIEAIQLGAFDYVTKPLDMEKICHLARRAYEVRRMKEKIVGLRLALSEQQGPEERLVGNSPPMQEVFKMIGAVCGTPNGTPVLIEGESGTGKELVAKAIHKNGPGRDQPFVVSNCTTLPENLLESELFGHEKGAFTGAHERRLGKLELAGRGVVFFDEIGDLSLNLQQKLLRVLQEREFERLGGNKILRVEARFVFASHRDLGKEVASGRFRKDLWFRINVIPIKLPPLRDRREDIPRLVKHFVERFNRELGKSITVVPDDVMDLLKAYNYPGNVRELSNLIEHGLILTTGDILNRESLPDVIERGDNIQGTDFPVADFNLRNARRDVLDAFEKKFLTELLKAHRGNVALASQNAGIEKQSLYRLMKKYNVEPHSFQSG